MAFVFAPAGSGRGSKTTTSLNILREKGSCYQQQSLSFLSVTRWVQNHRPTHIHSTSEAFPWSLLLVFSSHLTITASQSSTNAVSLASFFPPFPCRLNVELHTDGKNMSNSDTKKVKMSALCHLQRGEQVQTGPVGPCIVLHTHTHTQVYTNQGPTIQNRISTVTLRDSWSVIFALPHKINQKYFDRKN